MKDIKTVSNFYAHHVANLWLSLLLKNREHQNYGVFQGKYLFRINIYLFYNQNEIMKKDSTETKMLL